MAAKSLTLICHWFLTDIIPQLESSASYKIIHGKEISRAMLRTALAIDADIYPPEFRADEATCIAWYEHNPDIYTAIIEARTERLVGYINAMPVTEECFANLERDSSNDAHIGVDNIRTYDFGDFYKMHVTSFVIDPFYHASDAFRTIQSSAF